MRAIGVYVSAGGFSAGVEKHFKIIAHFTDGLFGHDSLQHNFPDVPIHHPGNSWGWPKKQVDFMYCAPPCAPFSPIGKGGKDWKNDKRVDKLRHAVNIGIRLKPKIWVVESVPGLPAKGWWLVERIIDKWMNEGYSITEFWTGGILHGIPQRRIRWHLIAHRVELRFPPPSSSVHTFREALEDRPPKDQRYSKVGGKMGMIMPYIPPGGKARETWAYVTGATDHLPGIPWRRCAWDRPATAITGAIRQIHPDINRVLTIGEIKSVCGYDQDFWLPESLSKSYAYLGKGVLPPVGEYLAAMAAESLKANVRLDRVEKHVVDYRPHVYSVMKTFPAIQKIDSRFEGIHQDWITYEAP